VNAAELGGWLREHVSIGGRPSERHDEERPAECMTCGRERRLNPALPLALIPRCDCRSSADGAARTLNWRVRLGAGEPEQLICDYFPQPFARSDRLRVAQPGRGAVIGKALDILRGGLARDEG
jgi:hypothetical protein